VAKFGRRFGWSFEAAINDDIDELEQVPDQFALAARKTEDLEALKQLCNTADGGPQHGVLQRHEREPGDRVP
jgi:hypothetical protein